MFSRFVLPFVYLSSSSSSFYLPKIDRLLVLCLCFVYTATSSIVKKTCKSAKFSAATAFNTVSVISDTIHTERHNPTCTTCDRRTNIWLEHSTSCYDARIQSASITYRTKFFISLIIIILIR